MPLRCSAAIFTPSPTRIEASSCASPVGTSKSNRRCASPPTKNASQWKTGPYGNAPSNPGQEMSQAIMLGTGGSPVPAGIQSDDQKESQAGGHANGNAARRGG